MTQGFGPVSISLTHFLQNMTKVTILTKSLSIDKEQVFHGTWFGAFLSKIGILSIEKITITSQYFLTDNRTIKSSVTTRSPITFETLNKLKEKVIDDCQRCFENSYKE